MKHDVSEGDQISTSKVSQHMLPSKAVERNIIHLADFRHLYSSDSLTKIAYFSLLATERRLCLLSQVRTLTMQT